MPPRARHPSYKGWTDVQSTFVGAYSSKGAEAFIKGPFEKLTARTDKTMRALDSDIGSGDRKASETSYLEFLKIKRKYKAAIKKATDADPNGNDFKAGVKEMFAFLEDVEGMAEVSMPKGAEVGKTHFAKDWSFAKKKFEAAKDDYLKTMAKALKKDGLDEDYQAEVANLQLRLNILESEVVNAGARLG